MISENDRQIAHEIATALNDKVSIGLYQKYATTVPHDILRDALQRVLSRRPDQIHVSRAAIFTSTIERYLRDVHGGSGY